MKVVQIFDPEKRSALTDTAEEAADNAGREIRFE